MNWQVISFYTVNTGYEQEIKKLESSLKRFKLPYHFFSYKPVGTWRKNLNYKSEAILKAFDMFPGKDIVFIDADAIVRQYPALFDELSEKQEYDIGACFFKYQPRSGDPDELLSGTLWVKNGENGHTVIKRWHKIGLEWPNIRHQKCLKVAIIQLQQEGVDIKVNRFPFEYTCIFDYGKRHGKDPVIEHFQASRRLRREVGYGENLIRNRNRAKEVGFKGPITTMNIHKLKRHLSKNKVI